MGICCFLYPIHQPNLLDSGITPHSDLAIPPITTAALPLVHPNPAGYTLTFMANHARVRTPHGPSLLER